MTETNELNWGMQINTKSYCKFDLDAPDWVKEIPGLSWYSEGLVVWDKDEKTILNLDISWVEFYLDELTKTDAWKIDGLDITREYIAFIVPVQHRRRKNNNVENQTHSEKVILKLHLSPERVRRFLVFLQENENHIRTESRAIKSRY